MNDKDLWKFPQVKFFRGLNKVLAVGTVPSVIRTQFLFLDKQVQAVVQRDVLGYVHGNATARVIHYDLCGQL